MRPKNSSRPKRTSPTERAEVYIRKAIFSGLFKPRQRLTAETLAAELKCSRGPIREAMLRLGRDGLVETIPRRGTFIPDVSPESIEVFFSMRGKLEGLCVRYMREEMTPAMPQKLSSILSEMRAAMKKEDQERFLKADLQLHRAIWRFSGRPQLERILETVMNSRGFLIAGTFSVSIPFRTRMKDHDEYVKTILRSPLSKVESEVERHFSDIYTQIFGESSTQRLISSL